MYTKRGKEESKSGKSIEGREEDSAVTRKKEGKSRLLGVPTS